MAIKLAVRIVVFGILIAFITRRVPRVRVQPRSALPLVALVFALLNTALYSLLAFVLNLATLWMLFLVVPFVANALLLWATDRVLKPFKVEGLVPLLVASSILTVAHFLLRLVHL